MHNALSRSLLTRLAIAAGSLFIFASFNGASHLFDWDEINFAESAREMLVSGNFSTVQINFRPFWEKPPLFIWMQALSMQLFGINEFAARFPNAICGMATLLLLFHAGEKLRGYRFGLLWTLIYAGSFLPFFYFKSGIIDPWFNLFIFSSAWLLMRYTDPGFTGSKPLTAAVSGVLIGLGMLTKGPVALLVLSLAVAAFFLIRRFRVNVNGWHVGLFFVAAALTGGSWFLWQWAAGNEQIIRDFIEYQIRLFNTQDAGHGGFLLYHFIVVLIGVFPASLFMIASLKREKNPDPAIRHYYVWNLILLLTVLILFTIVKTKIVHYSSLAYLPLSFLAATYLHTRIERSERLPSWLTVTTGVLVLFFALIMIIFSFIDDFKPLLLNSDLIKDRFAKANLQADGGWLHIEWVTGLILLAGFARFVVQNRQNRIFAATASLFVSCMLFLYLSMVLVVPRVERYSQRALIEFCQSVSDRNAWVVTFGFKSYANYFYASRKPLNMPHEGDELTAVTASPDKEIYAVLKIDKKEKYLAMYPQLEILYEKNGFVFTRWIKEEN